MNSNNPEVVISGVGLVTCLGRDCNSTWDAVLNGRCGVSTLHAIESPLNPNLGGGEVHDPEIGTSVDPANPRESQLLQLALEEALSSSGLRNEESSAQSRFAVVLGTSLHGMRNGGAYLRSEDVTALQSFLAGSVVRKIASRLPHVTFTTTTCSACSSGLASISLGCTLLQTHQADIVIAGGYDPISEYAYAGFNSMRLVSDTTLRPFARTRNGMKLAEGYAIVVLERTPDALARHTTPLARIVGFGESCDAFHLSKPHPDGAGAARAMRMALKAAHLQPDDINLLISHATATPDNDASEYAALRQVFGPSLPHIPVVGFKSHLGHSLGAAGAIDLILSAMALRDEVVPPCANIHENDIEYEDLKVACGQPTAASLQHVLNTSLGFGGANACMILAKPLSVSPQPASVGILCGQDNKKCQHDVVISGMGVVLPEAIGNEQFVQHINHTDMHYCNDIEDAIPANKYEHLINARRTRRMSEYAKLCLAATADAYRDAGIVDVESFGENCAALVATTHAASRYCETYYKQLIEEGIQAVNPILFAEGVPNVASAHLSTTFSITGFCQTLIGTRTAGLEALQLAAARISAGQWERAVVVAAEETTELITNAYLGLLKPCSTSQYAKPFSFSSGAIAFILESSDQAIKRQAAIRAVVATTTSSYATSRSPRARLDAAQKVVQAIGEVDTIFSSSNGTYLDRIDAAAIRRSSMNGIQHSIIHNACTERFSVGPLTALSTAIVRQIPRAGVICSDFYGSSYGAAIHLTPTSKC